MFIVSFCNKIFKWIQKCTWRTFLISIGLILNSGYVHLSSSYTISLLLTKQFLSVRLYLEISHVLTLTLAIPNIPWLSDGIHYFLSCVNPVFTARKPSLRRLCFHRCLSVHRGVCPIACWDTPIPPGRHPRANTPRQTPPGQTPPGQTPPWADPLSAQCLLGYGQQAGGMHPTGMHTCSVSYKIHSSS